MILVFPSRHIKCLYHHELVFWNGTLHFPDSFEDYLLKLGHTTFIIIYKTINLSTILHDLEISSLVLREIHRLRLFENCVLSEMGHMDLTQSKQQDGENCIKRFTICNFTQYCHKDQTKEN